MRTIEKNDVDISKLFQFEKAVKLLGANSEEVKVYMRLPGDSEINRARIKAIRKSRDLRDQLKDENWEDREFYIPDATELTKEQLVDTLVSFNITEIASQVAQDITITVPKEPDGDASLEEQEEYQRRVDEYPKLFNERLTKDLSGRLDKLKKELEKNDKNVLLDLYETQLIKEHANSLFYTKYREYCCYYATFSNEDYTEPLFDNFEAFENSPKLLKDQLLSEYDELELSAEELKKLQGAMQ